MRNEEGWERKGYTEGSTPQCFTSIKKEKIESKERKTLRSKNQLSYKVGWVVHGMISLLFFSLFWIFQILLIYSEYREIWTGWTLFNRVNTWPRVSKGSKACDRRLFSQDLFPSRNVRAICTNHLIISLLTLQKWRHYSHLADFKN